MNQTTIPDNELLRMALVGLEIEHAHIVAKIDALRGLIQAREPRKPVAVETRPVRQRRQLSAAARKRISAAQKRRWAEHHKKLAA